jgi:aminoglycoside phosphotransferase (APT) family kinase protein
MKINFAQNLLRQTIFSASLDKKLLDKKLEDKKDVFDPGDSQLSLSPISCLLKEKINNYKELGGGENLVYLVNNKYIFRIPRQQRAMHANRREQILLKELAQHVKSTQIPCYSFWDHKSGVGGYKEIKGIALTYKLYNNLSLSQKNHLARNLALAISEIHELPLKKAPFLKNAEPEIKALMKQAASLVFAPSILAQQDREKIQEALIIIENLLAESNYKLVVAHSDLHGDNILIDSSLKSLNGIIDFSDARIGFALIDFANLFRINRKLAEDTAATYARLKKIDVQKFLRECAAWSLIWQASCIAQNHHATTLRGQRRVIRAGRALS